MKYLSRCLLAVNFLLALVVTLLVLSFSSCDPVYAGPKEPPLSELHYWYPAGDGTIILVYRIVDKDGVQLWRFKHAQKAVAEKEPACNEVTIDGEEVYLLTQESRPSKYFIKKENDGSAPETSLDFTYDLW